MQYIDEKIFTGGMDYDSDNRLIEDGDYREARNCFVSMNKIGLVENIIGTKNIAYTGTIETYLNGTTKCIGSCEDIENNAIITFLYNSNGRHCIVRYKPASETIEFILYGESALNFSLSYPIYHANVINGLLYWTDNYNPPRKINIGRALLYEAIGKTGIRTFWYLGYYSTVTYTYNAGFKSYLINNSNNKVYRLLQTATNKSPLTEPSYWEDTCTITQEMRDALGTIDISSVTGGTPYGYLGTNLVYYAINAATLNMVKCPYPKSPSVAYGTDGTYLYNNLRGKLFQFAIRYVYNDFEKSVWSPISKVALPQSEEYANGDFNYTSSLNNKITLSFTDIDIYNVIRIEIGVKTGNFGIETEGGGNSADLFLYDVLSKDLDYATDSTSFTYTFYNDKAKTSLDQADVNQLFHAVPQLSGCQEIIEKNRLVFADITEGYNKTNIDVLLTVTRNAVSLTDIYLGHTGDVATGWNNYTQYVNANITPIDGIPTSGVTHVGWAAKINHPTTIVDAYYLVSINVFATVAATESTLIQFGCIILSTDTYSDVANKLFSVAKNTLSNLAELGIKIILINPGSGRVIWVTADANQYFTINEDITGYYKSYAKYKSYKNGAKHEFGIVYYDDGLRNNGVNINGDSSVFIPYFQGGETTVGYYNTITWTIKNAPPSWAKYYQWVYTKNTTITEFLQVAVKGFAYPATITDPTDIRTYNGKTRIKINRALQSYKDLNDGFNVSQYIYKKGDRIRIAAWRYVTPIYVYGKPTDYLDYEILGVDYDDDSAYDDDTGVLIEDSNNYEIIIEGIHTTQSNIFACKYLLVEVYTPAKQLDEKVFYEIGEVYAIATDGNNNKYHVGGTQNQIINSNGTPSSTYATGTFNTGDVYWMMRFLNESLFPAESSNYSDYYNSNTFDIGRPNIEIPDMRQLRRISSLRYSSVLIENSRVNGLSNFNVLDEQTVSEKYGIIKSIKEVGNMLKVLQQKKVHSIDIGRTAVSLASGDEQMVGITTVLGNVRTPDNSYGTENPESVKSSGRYIYFYDINNGCVLRDSDNGLFEISSYKMKNYFSEKSSLFITNNANPKAYSVFDNLYKTYLVTLQDGSTACEGIAFHEESNKWKYYLDVLNVSSVAPEQYVTTKNYTIAFLNGRIWQFHTLKDGSGNYQYNTLFGVQKPMAIKSVSKPDIDKNKVFESLTLNTNNFYLPSYANTLTGATLISYIAKQWRCTDSTYTSMYIVVPDDNYQSGIINYVDVLNQTPTAGGTTYAVGDLLTITTGGTGCVARVTSVNTSTGAVLAVELITGGTGYTVGTGKATSTTGSGNGCTLNITSVVSDTNHMESRLKPYKFVLKENTMYAVFDKDVHTPINVPDGADATTYRLLNGRNLRGKSIEIKLENSNTDYTNLFSIIVKSTPSERSKK